MARVGDRVGPLAPDRVRSGLGARGLLLLYLALVAYGSLVPFELRVFSFAEAWARFQEIRYLDLGAASRADWIANIVLYVPVGLLAAAAWIARPEGLGVRFAKTSLVVAGAVAMAVVLEFAQVFIAPRTVSLNDLLAEGLGSAMGAAFWALGSARIGHLAKAIATGGRPALEAGLAAYGLVYIGLSLFPYDFVVSTSELASRLAAGRDGLFLGGCTEPLRCAARLAAEVAATMPLGVLVMSRARTGSGAGRAFLFGLVLGAGLELVQLLMVSGVSQGASVVARALGMYTGAVGVRALGHLDRDRLWAQAGTAARALLLPYVLAVLALSGWFSHTWSGLGEAASALAGTRFLPFYYHYYVPEAVAMSSLLAVVGLYAPVGVAYRVWNRATAARGRAWPAMALAAGLALLAEAGKLFLGDTHADPTNVLLAGAAAGVAYWLLGWLAGIEPSPSVLQRGRGEPRPARPHPPQARADRRPGARVVAAVSAAAAVGLWLQYPDFRLPLALGTGVYAYALWHRPAAWLLALPVVAPAVNLAPWIGVSFIDTFDLFMLTTVAVVLWRPPVPSRLPPLPRPFRWLLAGLVLSYALALLFGLFPLSPLDANAFSSYYSHYNALRVAKGFIWAVVALGLIRLTVTDGQALLRYFAGGVTLGLAAVVAGIVIERARFTGLLDFESTHRVVGPFASMHIGGGHIEAYLVLATGLVLGLAGGWRDWRVRAAAVVLAAGAVYALIVTYSRSGYLGLAITLGLLLMLRLPALARARSGRRMTSLALVMVTALVGLLYPVAQGGFAERRLLRAESDLESRIAHWRHVLDLRAASWRGTLLGTGLGRFPNAYLVDGFAAGTPRDVAAIRTEDGRPYLRLIGGQGRLFVEQRVAATPHTGYRVVLHARSDTTGAALRLFLCEKTVLYSHSCTDASFRLDGQSGGPDGWSRYVATLPSRGIGAGPWYWRRPVTLSLLNPGQGAGIDVAAIALYDPDGRPFLDNGSFDRGWDSWLFTADQEHRPWHTHNLWVQLLFAQGWLGVLAFTGVLAYALVDLARTRPNGGPVPTAFIAALSGFLGTGLFVSPLDSPRIATLFFLTVLVAMLRPAGAWERGGRRDMRSAGPGDDAPAPPG